MGDMYKVLKKRRSYWSGQDMEKGSANIRRCTKCILPETFPGIEFDENGVCKYCLNYEPVKVLGESELENVLSKYRNRGEKYDCIAPISGGRDSAYVLHQLARRYKMRTLALTVDSGFITPEGIRNIERMTEILNVDHVWLRDEKKIEIAKRNVKMKFHGWLKKPSINTIIPVLNSGDKTMNLQMYNYAKENKIPLVLGGNIIGNCSFELGHFKTGFLGVFPDERGIFSTYDKIKLLFLFGLEYLRNPSNFRIPILKEYLEGAVVFYFESLLKPKGVVSLGFFDYIYWNENEILSTITKDLDWEGASDTTTTWRMDDAAYPLINYIYYKLVGFTEHDEMYSKMIREGQISREEALKRCMSDHKPRIPSLMRSFEELEVTREQVDEVLGKYREELLTIQQKTWRTRKEEK